MTSHTSISVPSSLHGQFDLPQVAVRGYSLEIWGKEGPVGDEASETAFREVLKSWQQTLELAGREPFGPHAADRLSRDELDRIASHGGTEAARMVAHAIDEFSARLAKVIGRFLRHAEWRGVQRIVIGGGFKDADVGRLAVMYTSLRLAEQGSPVELRMLHHASDDGGLVGWAQLLPAPLRGRPFIAIDIGGTNVRCGIVEFDGPDPKSAHVSHREKWRHADQKEKPQRDLVEGIVDMLRRLVAHAEDKRVRLSPFIGVSCPGVIRGDGSIERGAQNMPPDWQHASFHLPRRLVENLPQLAGAETQVLMHNDAVVQGLSELPWMRDVARWAVLTIGTGLGNASFSNRR